MADTHETIDGLLAEFHGYAAGMPPSYHVTMSWHDFRQMLDRLEAAHKREVDKLNSAIQATVSRSDAEIDRLRREIAGPRQAGNAAKLREAMKRIVASSIVAKNANAPEWILQRMADIFAMATIALSAPPRNCDVGTPEEQLKRKRAYCKAQDCRMCPFYGNDSLLCAFRWAQMPYKKGGAK